MGLRAFPLSGRSWTRCLRGAHPAAAVDLRKSLSLCPHESWATRGQTSQGGQDCQIRVDSAAFCLALRKGLLRDGVVFIKLFLPREALCLQPWRREVFPFVKEDQDPISGSPPGSGRSRKPQGPSGVCRVLVGLHSFSKSVCSAASLPSCGSLLVGVRRE